MRNFHSPVGVSAAENEPLAERTSRSKRVKNKNKSDSSFHLLLLAFNPLGDGNLGRAGAVFEGGNSLFDKDNGRHVRSDRLAKEIFTFCARGKNSKKPAFLVPSAAHVENVPVTTAGRAASF